MIVYRRRWCPIWAGILAAGGTLGLFAIALDMGAKGMEVAPLLLATTYLTLTLLCNATTYTLSPEGLSVKEGVIPAGFRNLNVERKAITGGYWRYNFRAPNSGESSHWAAGVTTVDGRWLDASTRYETEEPARDEAARLGRELGLSEVSRLTGEQPKRDLRVLGAILFWFGMVLFSLVGPILYSL